MEGILLFNLKSIGQVLLLLAFVSNLIGCNPINKKDKLINNDADIALNERPEFLDISASVIWDGDRTLGGNWISHPDIDSPERVLIKNPSNEKTVVGAVFQKTNNISKRTSTISSDAAIALNIDKNVETKVDIVAVTAIEKSQITNSDDVEKNQNIDTKLVKPIIQVGIFSIENNARKTHEQMRQLELPAKIIDFEIKGKPYWRVVVGPASTEENRSNMLNSIKLAGFTDAYFVSN